MLPFLLNPSGQADLPVDPPRPFLRLDVDIIVIDINLGNLDLKVVGKEPDGFPHRAEAGTPRRLKQRGRGRRACREERERERTVSRLKICLKYLHDFLHVNYHHLRVFK